MLGVFFVTHVGLSAIGLFKTVNFKMKKTIPSKLLSGLLIFSFIHLQAQVTNQKTTTHELVVDPLKMNVFYIGVDNPVEIAVTGIDDKNVRMALEGDGTIVKDSDLPYHYIVRVNHPGKCVINAEASINGRLITIGKKEFRVKWVSGATIMTTGGLEGGPVPTDKFKTQLGLKAMIKDIDIDAFIIVTSFSMIYISDGKVFKDQASSNVFTLKMKEYLKRAKPNDVFFFEDITVKGPSYQPRQLDTMGFYLQ
jgi:hypothetical protein